MALIDTAYLNAFSNPNIPDYVSMFTRGYNLASAMPWSAENRRKRALEDYQIQQKQAQFAAQMAQHQQEMQMKQALFPYQLQRAKALASGVADTPAPQGGLQNYIAALRAATQQGGPSPSPLPVPTEQPSPQPLSPIPAFGVDPDAPVF